MKYPLFVASKGRYDPKQAKTVNFLQKNNVPFILCVEEQERREYLKLVNEVLIYPSTGVGRARQFILEQARAMGAEFFWNLDDDVYQLRHNGHPVNPIDLFNHFETRMQQENQVGLIGPQYSQIVWRTEGPEIVNRQCPCIVTLSRTPNVFDYDVDLRIGEDLDWMFKYLLHGYEAIVDNRWTFDAQKSHRFEGKVGGIEYLDEELDSSITILERRYPGVVVRKGNTFRRNWRKLHQMIKDKEPYEYA